LDRWRESADWSLPQRRFFYCFCGDFSRAPGWSPRSFLSRSISSARCFVGVFPLSMQVRFTLETLRLRILSFPIFFVNTLKGSTASKSIESSPLSKPNPFRTQDVDQPLLPVFPLFPYFFGDRKFPDSPRPPLDPGLPMLGRAVSSSLSLYYFPASFLKTGWMFSLYFSFSSFFVCRTVLSLLILSDICLFVSEEATGCPLPGESGIHLNTKPFSSWSSHC